MYAAVPVKSLSQGKQRLSSLLSSKQRAGLSLAMTRDVLSALRDSERFTQIFICSGDATLTALAREFDAQLVLDQDIGARDLNTAIDALAEHLRPKNQRQNSILLTAHSDLPLITAEDIHRLLTPLYDCDVVLAPDRHGQGSNILARRLCHPFAAQFGENSLYRHRRQADALGLTFAECRLDGACWDMDRPEDIRGALQQFGLAAFGPATQQFLLENHLFDVTLSSALQTSGPQNTGTGESTHAVA